jgi:hypothetical protein
MFVSRLVPVLAMFAAVGQSYRHYWSTSATLPDDFQEPQGWSFEALVGHAFKSGCEGVTIPIIRVQNKKTLEIIFANSPVEVEALVNSGQWTNGGIAFYVFGSKQPDSIPWYRLWNPAAGYHLWTTDERWISQLTPVGWKNEGVAGWLPTTSWDTNDQVTNWAEAVPLYRYWHGAKD